MTMIVLSQKSFNKNSKSVKSNRDFYSCSMGKLNCSRGKNCTKAHVSFDNGMDSEERVFSTETYSPAEYDRASDDEDAKLTPNEFLVIAEELNEYKLSEMEVHPMSTSNTSLFHV
eukprot:CFRG4808T1